MSRIPLKVHELQHLLPQSCILCVACAIAFTLHAASLDGSNEWRERFLTDHHRDEKYRRAMTAQVGADVALLAQMILNLQVDVAVPPTPSMFFESNPFGGIDSSSLSELKLAESGRLFSRRSGIPQEYWEEDLPWNDKPSTYHTFEWAKDFYRQVAGINAPFDFYPVDRFSPEALPYRNYVVSDNENTYLLIVSNGPNLNADITDELILQVILGNKSMDDLRELIYDPDHIDSIKGDIAIMVELYSRPTDSPIRNPITGEALGSSGYIYDAALGRFSTWISPE